MGGGNNFPLALASFFGVYFHLKCLKELLPARVLRVIGYHHIFPVIYCESREGFCLPREWNPLENVVFHLLSNLLKEFPPALISNLNICSCLPVHFVADTPILTHPTMKLDTWLHTQTIGGLTPSIHPNNKTRSAVIQPQTYQPPIHSSERTEWLNMLVERDHCNMSACEWLTFVKILSLPFSLVLSFCQGDK